MGVNGHAHEVLLSRGPTTYEAGLVLKASLRVSENNNSSVYSTVSLPNIPST